MKITITGSLGNISRNLLRELSQQNHQVTVISSNPNLREEIAKLGGIPAIGDINDSEFLTAAFEGADLVYTMTPPNFNAADQLAYMISIGENYVNAIRKARIKKVVNLSSIGADLATGTGPIKGLHAIEHLFASLDGVAVKHFRAGYFFTNFLNDITTIKNMGIMGSNYPASTPLILVHPADIASAIAKEVEKGFEGHTVSYVYSDRKTAGQVATILGTGIGKPDLTWIELTDEQFLGALLQAGLPSPVASNYVEMGQALRKGWLNEDFDKQQIEAEKRDINLFVGEFAQKYQEKK